MPADVVDHTAIEHQNGIGFGQRRQPVRNDDQGSTMRDTRNVGVDDRFAVGVQRARRLVQDQDRRIDDQRPRNRQSLPLAAREVRRTFITRRSRNRAAVCR